MPSIEIVGVEFGPRDLTVWGWSIFAGYLVAAAIAVGAGLLQRRREGAPRRLEWFWYGLAIALVALAANKQLDLQSYGTEFGARHAWQHGWYGERRFVQVWFIRGVFLAGLVIAFALVLLYRRASPPHWLAILGFSTLLAFIAVRASSLHRVDNLLRDRVANEIPLNIALEGGGILVIALAALWAVASSLAALRAPRLASVAAALPRR